MADKIIYSFVMNGVKQDFADWISNISPTDTPFTSSIKKDQTNNTKFQWQTDALAAAGSNAQKEGDDATATTATPTTVEHNYTQIFSKVAKVSKTSDALDSWGRGQESAYQLTKKAKEFSRDVEFAFLNNGIGRGEDVTKPTPSDRPRLTSGVRGLVAALSTTEPVTGLPVRIHDILTEDNLFTLTKNLYMVGAQPNVIMFNPKHASTFAGFIETTGQAAHRVKMFDGVAKRLNTYVQTFIDPLGQEFTLIPNRLMPEDIVLVYRPEDFTQMTLRAPSRIPLASSGDYSKEMILGEMGLRLSNPFAAGIFEVVPASVTPGFTIADKTTASATGGDVIPFASLFTVTGAADPADFDFAYTPAGAFTRSGTNFTLKNDIAAGAVTVVATGKTGSAADGMSATATITAAKPKLTGITLTSTVAGWASDAVTVAKGAAAFDVTLAAAPTGAGLGTWTVASGDSTATGVTVVKKGTNQVTVTPGATGKAGATTVTITSGTVTKTFAVTVTP